MRLFNEPAGQDYLKKQGVDSEFIDKLDLLGISSIANLIGSIKMANFYEMDERDVIFTIATDSMELYQSRLKEAREKGEYTKFDAAEDYGAYLREVNIDHMQELTYWDKKSIHNLKYFTWIEQRGKDVDELERQWYDETYWKENFSSYKKWDELIREFNEKVGLL